MRITHPLTASSCFALALVACGGGDAPAPAEREAPPSASMSAESAEPGAGMTDSADPGTLMTKEGSRPVRSDELLSLAGELAADGRNVPVASARPAPEVPAAGAGGAGFELSWRDCGLTGTRPVQCAELQVPLDHDDPDGERILIALNRIAPLPGVERRGALLYNPGGPGGSGKDYVRVLARLGSFDAVAPGFDIVGFDPRGVGDSSALECEFIEAYLAGDTGVEQPADTLMEVASEYGLDGLVEDLTWLSEQCRGYWGALFDHMGSNEVVRDIELIRQALGEEKLNFLGMSYGTRLGALYAQQYPERVRAIVLDAPVGPEASIVEQVQDQFDETLVMQEAFFAHCDSGRFACPPDARDLFDAYVTAADQLGLLGPMLGVWRDALSYGYGSWYLPYLLEMQAAEPTSDWMLGELESGSDYTSFIQNLNVNCADNAAPLLTFEQADARLGDGFERSPLFGAELASIVLCNGWTVAPDPVAPLTAPGSPPLLVIGGVYDWRTPGARAEELAGSLENTTLIMSEHWGHTIVGDGSPCVDDAVRNYLVDLVLPEPGLVCPPPEQ